MVMDYVQAALRGDLEQLVRLSFDCLSCGLCAVRCPAEIVPYNIGQLARRIYSKHVIGSTSDVLEKAEQVEEGNFNKKIQKLKESDENFLKELYENREMVLD
jgi:heterodisulfide reductase subunit C